MYLVGIDEVGRGPIAGPVVVGACAILDPKIARSMRNFRDSKKMSEKQREEWYTRICMLQKEGKLNFATTFVSEKIIDAKGLSYAINSALSRSLSSLKLASESVRVLLDGGLKAPAEYVDQKTIIKGDEKRLAIALASIVAKVERDRKMVKLAMKYPGYGFEVHKGYGTKKHYEAIRKMGILALHRKSFLKSSI